MRSAPARRFPFELPDRLAWWLAAGAQGVGVVVVAVYAWRILSRAPWRNDAYGFWIAWDGGLYDIPWLVHDAYVYSPAFAQAIAPLTELSLRNFLIVWAAMQIAALLLMAGPAWSAVILLLPWPSLEGYPNAVVATIQNGNPQLLVALAIVAGCRWPAAWALPLLTKVTPGIGLLWFAIRRDWRALAIAGGMTLAVVAVSALLDVGLWFEWFGLLAESAGADTLTHEPILPLPLVVRLPLAVAIVAWGALTARWWPVAVGATLALPAIQLGGFALLVAALPFLGLPLTPRWPLAGRLQAQSGNR